MNRSRRHRLDPSNDPDPGGGVRAGGLVRHLPGGYAAQGEGCGRRAKRGALGPASPLAPRRKKGAGKPHPHPPGRGLESPPASGLPTSPTLRNTGAGRQPSSPSLAGRRGCRSPAPSLQARAGGARPFRS